MRIPEIQEKNAKLYGSAAAIIETKPDKPLTEEDVNTSCLDMPCYQRPQKSSLPRFPAIRPGN